MFDWFIESGFIYLLGVAFVTLVGLLVVYRGLWGDRSKGRVRCPKCWYDMRGSLPKLECPECGHDAQQEHRLYRNRRRSGRIVIGVVLVLGAASLLMGRQMERHIRRQIEQEISRLGSPTQIKLYEVCPSRTHLIYLTYTIQGVDDVSFVIWRMKPWGRIDIEM
jgi:hypothetical protein